MSRQYLRTHHGEKCTITKVRSENYKGQEQGIVTFTAEDGALIDLKIFKDPAHKQHARTKYMLSNLLKAAGVKSASELTGKSVVVTVARNDWNGKSYYNPINFAPLSYSEGSGGQLDEQWGTEDTDDIGF